MALHLREVVHLSRRLANRIALKLNHLKQFFRFGEPDDEPEEPDPEQLELANQIEDLKWVMSDKRGRSVVWRQLEIAGIYRLSYTGDDRTAFNEGQRNIGLKLLAEINQHCPAEYMEMLKEHSQ